MVRLFIGSMSDFSGKSLLSIGIGLVLKNRGYKIGYIKPVGRNPVRVDRQTADLDAVTAREALGLEDSLPAISPYMLGFEEIRTALTRKAAVSSAILGSIKAIKGKDVLIIEGASNLFDGSIIRANGIQIIKGVKARSVMVEAWRGDDTINPLLFAGEILKESLAGCIINMVSTSELEYVNKTVKPFLKKQGIEVFGVLQRDAVLGSISIRQLRDSLNGKVLCCEEKLDDLVEHYLIGAMDVNSAMKYFRRTPNKAVITGGHRSDIQLAALETSTKCIILTGGFYTSDLIISRAESMGIPILSAAMDTFTAIEKIESILGHTHLKGDIKIRKCHSLVKAGLDFPQLLRQIGLPS